MKYDPVWKRYVEESTPSAVDDAANVMSGYETQLSLNLNKPADATPEEAEEWYETELKPWGDRQLNIVAIATLVQVTMLGLMFAVMAINQNIFS